MAILERSDTGAVAHLKLNAPERMNALSNEMIAALQSQFDSLKDDNSIRVVVLSANGKAFCAGHDLKQMTAARQNQDAGKAAFADLFARCSQMMLSIRALPQPVIAVPHGIATAAGCQLVASCDLAVAEAGTRFGVNGVNIGLFCSTPMVALSRNIPRKHAFEMLTTGAFISAERAAELGLVNRVAVGAEAKALKMAELIASKLGAAVKIGKQAFYQQGEMSLEDAYAFTGDVIVENMLYRDTEEGIAAFLEKRDPDWNQ
ncbi:enoyl-CoA hydratase [Lentibacter algarum]|nr:enoyl-CoA hydratase [Lentibacter algarum]